MQMTPEAADLPRVIAQRRSDLQLSAEYVAKQIGVPGATLLAWEQGREEIPFAFGLPIAISLDLDPGALLFPLVETHYPAQYRALQSVRDTISCEHVYTLFSIAMDNQNGLMT